MDKLYPITFSIPEEKIVKHIPIKKRILSPLIPGKKETYIYNDEDTYYNHYKESMFATTTKKAGWDCLRHYEILACGTIPYFPDIEKCPFNTLALFPKKFIIKGNELYEKISKYEFNNIPHNLLKEYYDLLHLLLTYLRKYLSTEKIATYILKKINRDEAKKILYLSFDMYPDYLRCLTLHGFKSKFGLNCTDYPKIPHIYKNQNIEYNELYGKGISYTNLLEQSMHNNELKEEDILQNIKNKYYDLIIYGSYHRGMLYYDIINNFYKPEDIILLCGEDIHECNYKYFLSKGHHIFVREMN